jgi:hypothetical protein
MKRTLLCLLLGATLTCLRSNDCEGAEWGPTVNGLRMSAAIAKNEFGNHELEWTIENTSQVDEKFLVLGKVGHRYAELVKVVITEADGSRHAGIFYDQRGGTALSRELPMIVPLLPKSKYSARTLLAGWAYTAPDLRRLETLLSQVATLHLQLDVGIDGKPDVRTDCSLDCFGLQIFWRGRLVSNTLRFPLTEKSSRSAGERAEDHPAGKRPF